MSEDSPNDFRTPREKASKIPSWIMVGFLLGGLTFYTVNDYLSNRKKAPLTPPQPAQLAQPTATPSSTTPDATTSVTTATTTLVPLDTGSKLSPLLDNSRQMTLFAMDAVFREWMVNAMWEYDTTQVIFWNPNDGKYSVPVEVYRLGTEASGYEYYYRRLARVTRPTVHDDTRPDAPIIFTESEEATKRRKEKQSEFWRR